MKLVAILALAISLASPAQAANPELCAILGNFAWKIAKLRAEGLSQQTLMALIENVGRDRDIPFEARLAFKDLVRSIYVMPSNDPDEIAQRILGSCLETY